MMWNPKGPLALVLPAYNEEQDLPRLLERIKNAFGRDFPTSTVYIESDLDLSGSRPQLFFYCLKFINFYWGLVNLLPVLPLDGGHIMQALMMKYWRKKPQQRVLEISIVASGGMAYWAYQSGERYVVILFILLCANSVVQYNELKNHRRW